MLLLYWIVGTGYIQVLYLGRAPRTKETLPDFREKCRVNRHSRVFRWLTGSQQTHEIWGVTAWYQSLGIRIPWVLEFGYPSPLGGLMFGLGMRLPTKARNKTRTLQVCFVCALMHYCVKNMHNMVFMC